MLLQSVQLARITFDVSLRIPGLFNTFLDKLTFYASCFFYFSGYCRNTADGTIMAVDKVKLGFRWTLAFLYQVIIQFIKEEIKSSLGSGGL